MSSPDQSSTGRRRRSDSFHRHPPKADEAEEEPEPKRKKSISAVISVETSEGEDGFEATTVTLNEEAVTARSVAIMIEYAYTGKIRLADGDEDLLREIQQVCAK